MARPLRIEYPGALYHITSRGNARQDIYNNDRDKTTFLEVLQSVVERCNWLCHSYCLMTNHYHLIVETPEGNLSQGMRQLNGVYTQKFNQRYDSAGHLFQGRYKAILIEKESYLLSLCRYVVLNPVRAGIVHSPEQWIWNSYRATAGLTKKPPFLTIDWLLSQFGETREEAVKSYREYIHGSIEGETLWNELKGQMFLGSKGFLDRMKTHLEGKQDSREVPRIHRYATRSALEKLLHDLQGKDPQESDDTIYSAYAFHGYTMKDIADYAGVHYSTISRAIRRAESLRDKK